MTQTLDQLRRETEKTRCPSCGEPFDLLPCCRRHQAKQEELINALRGMFKAAEEIAVEFIERKRATDWGVVNNAYLTAEKILKSQSVPEIEPITDKQRSKIQKRKARYSRRSL